MNPTLLDIPFDHFQRYAAATHLLNAMDMDSSRVLEVGANRQRLLGQFLPQATFLYTDLHAEGDEKDFVIADATQLPFEDRSFDAVVSLDVLEHIPAQLRARAVAEMARVADRMVVIGCPSNEAWVREAEVEANGRWQELYGEDYVWLEEHKEFGLVESAEVELMLARAGMQVLCFGQGDARLWASLMGSHFIKVKFPELDALVQAADRLYNTRVFAGDHSDQSYRKYYVGVRSIDDAARLSARPPFHETRDEEATEMLAQLSEGLRRLALRTNSAELQWAETARLLEACAADLDVAKREWASTATYVRQLQAALDAASQQLQAAKDDGKQQLEAAKAAGERQLEAAKLAGEQQLEAAKDASEQQLQAVKVAGEELLEAAKAAGEQQLRAAKAASDQQWQDAQALMHELNLQIDQERKYVTELQQDRAGRAVAYARSRRRWRWAAATLTVGALIAGLLAGWAWL
ncbi:methyltransferase domain-containing protein [Xanthomonas sp. Kuri4-1]